MNQQNVVTTDNEVKIDMPIDLDGVKWIYTTDDSQLAVKCPHCGRDETGELQNEWEYIADDKEWAWTCEHCNQDYTIGVQATATLHLTLKVQQPVTTDLTPAVTEGL